MSKKNYRTILIVDDDEDDFFITSDYIKKISGLRSQVDWSYNYIDALKKMATNSYDIFFVDYRLGIKTGMDLLNDAVQQGCEQPIILLTGKGTPEIEIKAIESGAYDYLVKSELNTEKLERCIRYSMERAYTIQALKMNEKRYRSIFEKSKDIIFTTTYNFEILDINYAATELLDFELEKFQGMELFSLFKDQANKEYLIDMLYDVGEFYDFEVDLIAKNNETKSCIISASVEINYNGEKYIQGIIHDNTIRKKAEKATLLAEKMAATGRLVRTLAHEVRNPLNNISLSIEQLIQHSELQDSERIAYLEIVKRNSNRISALITELLDSSRMSSNINLARHSITAIIDKAIVAAIDRITLKHIELQVFYPPNECFVLLDEEKMKLALINIIINAIEAMEEEGGVLSISVKSFSEEIFIEIKDNGCGIREEQMPRLFEPYFTTKRSGMGLGLAATLNIIQSHEAHIDVKSEVGEGTSFIIGFKKEK